jgi:hypothetical protein
MGTVDKHSKQAKASQPSPKGRTGASHGPRRVKSGGLHGKGVKPSRHLNARPEARAETEIGLSRVPTVSPHTEDEQTQGASNNMRQRYVTIGNGRF